jgi:hypothetical protein
MMQAVPTYNEEIRSLQWDFLPESEIGASSGCPEAPITDGREPSFISTTTAYASTSETAKGSISTSATYPGGASSGLEPTQQSRGKWQAESSLGFVSGVWLSCHSPIPKLLSACHFYFNPISLCYYLVLLLKSIDACTLCTKSATSPLAGLAPSHDTG